jgi:hypothetical protein
MTLTPGEIDCRLFKPRHGSDPKFPPKDKRKLAWYFLFATGTPLTVLIITAIFEFDLFGQDHLLKPDFGIRTCFFHPEKNLSRLVFLHVPILLMQVSISSTFLRTNFSYKSHFGSFFTYVLALNKLSFEKCTRIMLMKLTAGVNVANILQVAICANIFVPKITKLKRN